VSFGVLGWLGAHALTYALLSHEHGVDAGGRHVHSLHGAAAVVTGFLAAASMLAVFAVGLRRPGGRPPAVPEGLGAPEGMARTARWASALSTAGFVVAEFVEYALAGGHTVPPPLVLVVGGVVQAVVGAATGLVWRFSADSVFRLAAGMRADHAVAAPPPRRPWAVRAVRPHPRWAVHRLAGRSPPA